MNNKTAVVSGASGGIGIAVSKALYNAGYNIVLLYNKNKKPLEDEFSTDDKKILMIQGDLSKECDILKIKEEVYATFHGVDVIVNNAGISLIKFFDETTCEEWDRVFDVNVKSAFMLTKAFIPEMINRKSGNIINISSMWGISGASMEVCYSASKAAMIGMSKALAKELGPSGINVNVIAPGVIETKMNEHISKEDMDVLIEDTPINRIGKPEDIANAVMFLCDEKASFITGEVIKVDGGFIL